jgi:hypothetical protein
MTGLSREHQVCKSEKETLVKQDRFNGVVRTGARKSLLRLRKEVPWMVGMTAVQCRNFLLLFLVFCSAGTREKLFICSKTFMCFQMRSPHQRRLNLPPPSPSSLCQPKAIVASKGHHSVIASNIFVNRMFRRLKGSISKYARGGSIVAQR